VVDEHWLCLDCGKDLLHTNDGDYRMIRHRLWRQIVPREQRHGMLCLPCMEKRLQRPLAPEDFLDRGQSIDETDPMDRCMQREDYGIIDSITDEQLDLIDQRFLSQVKLQPRYAGAILRAIIENRPPGVPDIPEFFWVERLDRLIDSGRLIVTQQGADQMHDLVGLP
jgi:hypothetical protein